MSDRAQSQTLLRVPSSLLTTLRRAASRKGSAEEAAALAREVGLDSGESFYELFRDWLSEAGSGAVDPQRLSADEFWDRLSAFFAQLGWGGLGQEQLHAGVLALSSPDWAEAGDGAAHGQPSCHLTTGLLADLLRRVGDEEIAAMEVECRSAGHDRCRFLVGSPRALDGIFERIRSGESLADAVASLS